MSPARIAVAIARPYRQAIRNRESANVKEWPGHETVQELDAAIIREQFKCVYLVRTLQNRHVAAILSRAAFIPGYIYTRV